MQTKFILKCIQYMATSALWSKQFTFGVKNARLAEICMIYWSAVSRSSVAWTSASRRFLHTRCEDWFDAAFPLIILLSCERDSGHRKQDQDGRSQSSAEHRTSVDCKIWVATDWTISSCCVVCHVGNQLLTFLVMLTHTLMILVWKIIHV